MILARELRIGNLFKGIGGIQTVLSLEENTDRGRCNYSSEEHRLMYSHLILCHQNGNQYKPFEIDGIPLTEEILAKLEYNKETVDGILVHEHNLGLPIIYTGSEYKFYDIELTVKLKYVHQLQNAQFVLTGQELNTQNFL